MDLAQNTTVPPKSVAAALEASIEWLVIGLLAFAALSFGGVSAGSELVIITAAAAVTVLLLARTVVEPGKGLRWSWAYVPVAGFLALAAGQLIPLPSGIVGVLSPETAALKTRLLTGLPDGEALVRLMTLSFYPRATAHGLRLALAATAVFVAVVNVHRRSAQIKRLLVAIAIIGGAAAALALGQIATGTDKLYWLVEAGRKVADGGPFVNHSNYSQFMNLSIGSALALMFVKLHESFAGAHVTPAGVAEHLAGRAGLGFWALAAMVIVGAATVFLSLSRGGALSLLAAGGVTTLVLTARSAPDRSMWLMAMVGLGAMVCVLYVGFDAVSARLATLRSPNVTGRWQLIKDATGVWGMFPLLGTGLGTHAFLYPMFNRAATPSLAAHVENEYVQTAEETGAVGLGLMLLFLALVWVGYAACVRRGSRPIHSAAFGLGFGLLAVIVHSLSDFGQRLPANACLSAVSCALLVGLARTPGESKTAKRGRSPTLAAWLPLAVVAVAGAWAVHGAARAYLAERAWLQALRIERGLSDNDWRGSDEQYAALLASAETAVEHGPDDVEYRYWLAVWRWRSISRQRDPLTDEVVLTPRTLARGEEICRELQQAQGLCPTFAPVLTVAGQLQASVLGRPEGTRDIRMGYELAPGCPTSCLVAGLLDAREGRQDEALAKLRRALTLDEGLFEEIARSCVREMHRPELAVALAEGDAARLGQLEGILEREADGQR